MEGRRVEKEDEWDRGGNERDFDQEMDGWVLNGV